MLADRANTLEAALQQIAGATHGQYYRAERADQLQTALADQPNHFTLGTERIDLAAWFAAAVGPLIALPVGLSLWWNRIRVRAARPRRADRSATNTSTGVLSAGG